MISTHSVMWLCGINVLNANGWAITGTRKIMPLWFTNIQLSPTTYFVNEKITLSQMTLQSITRDHCVDNNLRGLHRMLVSNERGYIIYIMVWL